MLSDRDRRALGDIVHNIDLAFSFLQGVDEAAFAADLRTFYAVTRCLEIVSEASRRLSAPFKAAHPDIAWRNIAGAGDVYRHDYELVAQQAVWRTVHEALPSLRTVASGALPPVP